MTSIDLLKQHRNFYSPNKFRIKIYRAYRNNHWLAIIGYVIFYSAHFFIFYIFPLWVFTFPFYLLINSRNYKITLLYLEEYRSYSKNVIIATLKTSVKFSLIISVYPFIFAAFSFIYIRYQGHIFPYFFSKNLPGIYPVHPQVTEHTFRTLTAIELNIKPQNFIQSYENYQNKVKNLAPIKLKSALKDKQINESEILKQQALEAKLLLENDFKEPYTALDSKKVTQILKPQGFIKQVDFYSDCFLLEFNPKWENKKKQNYFGFFKAKKINNLSFYKNTKCSKFVFTEQTLHFADNNQQIGPNWNLISPKKLITGSSNLTNKNLELDFLKSTKKLNSFYLNYLNNAIFSPMLTKDSIKKSFSIYNQSIVQALKDYLAIFYLNFDELPKKLNSINIILEQATLTSQKSSKQVNKLTQDVSTPLTQINQLTSNDLILPRKNYIVEYEDFLKKTLDTHKKKFLSNTKIKDLSVGQIKFFQSNVSLSKNKTKFKTDLNQSLGYLEYFFARFQNGFVEKTNQEKRSRELIGFFINSSSICDSSLNLNNSSIFVQEFKSQSKSKLPLITKKNLLQKELRNYFYNNGLKPLFDFSLLQTNRSLSKYNNLFNLLIGSDFIIDPSNLHSAESNKSNANTKTSQIFVNFEDLFCNYKNIFNKRAFALNLTEKNLNRNKFQNKKLVANSSLEQQKNLNKLEDYSSIQILTILQDFELFKNSLVIQPRIMSGYEFPDTSTSKLKSLIVQLFYHKNLPFLNNFLTQITNPKKPFLFPRFLKIQTSPSFTIYSTYNQPYSAIPTFNFKYSLSSLKAFEQEIYTGPAVLRDPFTYDLDLKNKDEVSDWIKPLLFSDNPITDRREVFFGQKLARFSFLNEKDSLNKSTLKLDKTKRRILPNNTIEAVKQARNDKFEKIKKQIIKTEAHSTNLPVVPFIQDYQVPYLPEVEWKNLEDKIRRQLREQVEENTKSDKELQVDIPLIKIRHPKNQPINWPIDKLDYQNLNNFVFGFLRTNNLRLLQPKKLHFLKNSNLNNSFSHSNFTLTSNYSFPSLKNKNLGAAKKLTFKKIKLKKLRFFKYRDINTSFSLLHFLKNFPSQQLKKVSFFKNRDINTFFSRSNFAFSHYSLLHPFQKLTFQKTKLKTLRFFNFKKRNVHNSFLRWSFTFRSDNSFRLLKNLTLHPFKKITFKKIKLKNLRFLNNRNVPLSFSFKAHNFDFFVYISIFQEPPFIQHSEYNEFLHSFLNSRSSKNSFYGRNFNNFRENYSKYNDFLCPFLDFPSCQNNFYSRNFNVIKNIFFKTWEVVPHPSFTYRSSWLLRPFKDIVYIGRFQNKFDQNLNINDVIKVNYHVFPSVQILLNENLTQTTVFGNTYKKIPTVYQNVFNNHYVSLNNYKKSKTFKEYVLTKFSTAFYESCEDITPESWMMITQFSFGLIVVQVLQDFYRRYGIELASYLTDVLASTGVMDEITKQELNLDDQTKTYRVIRQVPKRFRDIAGIDDILQQLGEIVWFLRNSGRSSKLSNIFPKGILLIGPPGTGKTLLVQAIAGEAEVPVLIQSGSSLKDSDQEINGVQQLKNLFEEAQQIAPCIIFIDEIDTFGEKRTNVMQNTMGEDDIIESLQGKLTPLENLNANLLFPVTNQTFENVRLNNLGQNELQTVSVNPEISTQNSESFDNTSTGIIQQSLDKQEAKQEQVNLLMQFLIEMDGLRARKGIIVIGATNRPDTLDLALTRPGRFDQILPISLPGKQKRIEILKLYSKNLGTEATFSKNIKCSKFIFTEQTWNYLANRTVGFSAADLAAVMNQSSMKAILNETVHTIETIEKGIESITTYNSEKPKVNVKTASEVFFISRLAYYQAGKALVQTVLVQHPSVTVLYLWPQQKNKRQSYIDNVIQNKFFKISCKSELEARLIGLYAGKASEYLILDKQFSNHASFWQSDLGVEDLAFATSLMGAMINKWYFYSKDVVIRRSTQIISAHSENQDLDSLELIKQLAINTENELAQRTRSTGFTRNFQKWSIRPWWQTQITQRIGLLNPTYDDWYRIYLPDPEESERNDEWIAPDEYYHDNNNLSNLKLSSSRTFNFSSMDWNELYASNRDYIYHGLLLRCFNTAFKILDQNRELLDYFAFYLMQNEIIREHEITDIFVKFKNQQIIKQKLVDTENQNQNAKINTSFRQKVDAKNQDFGLKEQNQSETTGTSLKKNNKTQAPLSGVQKCFSPQNTSILDCTILKATTGSNVIEKSWGPKSRRKSYRFLTFDLFISNLSPVTNKEDLDL